MTFDDLVRWYYGGEHSQKTKVFESLFGRKPFGKNQPRAVQKNIVIASEDWEAIKAQLQAQEKLVISIYPLHDQIDKALAIMAKYETPGPERRE